MKLNGGQLAGLLIIFGSLGAIAFQATRSESTVTFYTPAEVYADPSKFIGELFRVSGLVLKGTRVWDKENNTVSFRMTDLEGHDFLVRYKGIPPDLFKEGQGVVVEGKLLPRNQSGSSVPYALEADLLMVKHSEVYDTKKEHSQMKEARLLDSMLKDQNLNRSSFK